MKKNAHWLLRLAFASVFLYHGLTKFPSVQAIAEAMDVSVIAVYMITAAESLAGLLVLIGGFGIDWATRTAALLIVPIMVGAIKIHWGQWSFMPSQTHASGGIEFQIVLLSLALYFLLRGNES